MDIEAVRVRPDGLSGVQALLREVWERYRLPLAITEAHLACHREEQLRWLHGIWSACDSLARDGVDLRAVTVWSLLGAFNWDTLLTSTSGRYESGAFDLRASAPRPTAIAACTASLATHGSYDHPVLDEPGWWNRPDRFLHPMDRPAGPALNRSLNSRKILIVGADSMLGRAFARICALRHLPIHAVESGAVCVDAPEEIHALIRQVRPWAIVNTLDYCDVSAAESNPAACRRINVRAAEILAEAGRRAGVPLASFSSNLVFGGSRATPFLENAPVSPMNQYGISKVDGENAVRATHRRPLIVRTGALLCPWDSNHFVARTFRSKPDVDVYALKNIRFSPSYVPDVVHTTLDLLIDGAEGVWHLCNSSDEAGVSWEMLANLAVERSSSPNRRVVAVDGCNRKGHPRIPSYSVMRSERGWLMPSLDDALARCFSEHQWR